MPSDLLLIGRSGAQAAQAALGVTAQNVANAGDADYSRRRIETRELAGTGGVNIHRASRLSGVLIEGVARSEAHWLAAEARRTGASLAGADARIEALARAEVALERSGVPDASARLAGSLTAFEADPLSQAGRAVASEDARRLATAFNLAATELAAAGEGVAVQAADGVARANRLAADLAVINTNILRAPEGGAAHAALADRRDAALRDLAALTGAEATVDGRGRARVAIGERVLVADGRAGSLTSTGERGRLAFALDGEPVALRAGALAGLAAASERIVDLSDELDATAADLVARIAAAQGNGDPLFAGGTAATLVATGAAIAAGRPGTRDGGNLTALAAAVDGNAIRFDGALSGLSAAIAGDALTREALETIAESASLALEQEVAVDLDAEAVNLLRYQQAFQASGKVIQTAAAIFDTMLAIR